MKICEKSRIWSNISKNLDFGQIFLEMEISVEIFWKISILVEIFRKIFILVEIFENLDFGRNLRKISIFSKFLKMSYFGGNFL